MDLPDNSLSLDTAWGALTAKGERHRDYQELRRWGKSILSPELQSREAVMDCCGLRTCEAGKQNHSFPGHYIKLTQKFYFTKALPEHLLSVFQEFKVISKNLSAILANYKPHRKLTFSYTTHRG